MEEKPVRLRLHLQKRKGALRSEGTGIRTLDEIGVRITEHSTETKEGDFDSPHQHPVAVVTSGIRPRDAPRKMIVTGAAVRDIWQETAWLGWKIFN